MRRLSSMLLVLCLILASCGGSSDGDEDSAAGAASASEEAEANSASEPEAEPEPEPTATPEPEPDPTATPEPEPTATPEPDPTATPEPEPEPEAEAERDFAPVTAAVEAFLDDEGLPGAGLIIVHRDEGVLYHEHFGEFTEDRVSMIASASKSISAGVLMRLEQDGLLDIDAPIADAVDWADDHPEMLPVQLISNSSGLVGLGPDLLYGPYLCQWLPGPTIQECGAQVLGTPGDDGDIITPDTQFRYGGAQWQVAGALAEAVTGKSWGELVDEYFGEPCGLDATGFVNILAVSGGATDGYPVGFGGDPAIHEPTANPNIEGGGYSTTGDYGKLLLMHLRNGECENGQVFTQESLDRMRTDRISSYGGSTGGSDGYGMGWWINEETGIISDGGAWGAYPWLNLGEGYGGYWVIEDSFQTTGRFSDELIAAVHLAVTGSELS
ncbi:MAG: serine hydrolase domain-containing protein [Actinomycetota bacterium]